MAKAKLTEKEKKQQELVEEKVSSVEKFFDEHKKTIWGVLLGIVLAGLVVLAVFKFYLQPLRKEARGQLFPAEASFRAENYDLALNGDGNVLGFSEIISTYGRKAGAAVYLYAGICELRLGNFDNALQYLRKYNGKDKILAARAHGCEGDAYAGLEKYPEALACYEKAAGLIDNPFTAGYLLKAGIVCEELGDHAGALNFYRKIKDRYPMTQEGSEIDKYIARIENKEN